MNQNHIGYKILHLSITKIIIGLFVIGSFASIGQIYLEKLLLFTEFDKDSRSLIAGIIISILSIACYSYLYMLYEKRKITEFSRSGMLKYLIYGTLLGALLQSLTILVIYLKGGYSFISLNSIAYIIPPLTMSFTTAIIEEILMRGIIFRITEEKLGSYYALIISAFIFGAMHIANPNSSFLAALGLAIQAGLLLASAYIYSRNLWFPIAIHFSWNFTQSAIFGANVSGNTVSRTLITSNITGAEWYTGGKFGPEGSIQATVFCLIATCILLTLSHKEGKIRTPYWKTQN